MDARCSYRAETAGSMRIWAVLLATLAVSVVNAEPAASGQQLVETQCISCHALKSENDRYYMLLREGPPLIDVGNKFRREWLLKWLQAPERIRPAGYLPFRYTVSGPDGDRVDPTLIPAHPAVTAAQAEAIVEWFFSQRKEVQGSATTHEELKRGELQFRKILGCGGCHLLGGEGGLSSPELGSARARLDAQWLRAFVSDTSMWAPASMPKVALRPTQLSAVVEFIENAPAAQPQETAATLKTIGASTARAAPSDSAVDKSVPTDRAAMLYQVYCSQCHGVHGNGKGINAPFLFVTPRDHTSVDEMGRLTDQDIFTAIKMGGQSVGKSALMPSWAGTIADDDIRVLVGYVRSLSGRSGRDAN